MKQAELEESLKSFQYLKIKFKHQNEALIEEKHSLENLVKSMLIQPSYKLNMDFVENTNFNLSKILNKPSGITKNFFKLVYILTFNHFYQSLLNFWFLTKTLSN